MNRLPAAVFSFAACLALTAACSKSGKTEKAESTTPGKTETTQAQGHGDLEKAIAAKGDKLVTAVSADGTTTMTEVGKTKLAETPTYIVSAKLPASSTAGAESVVTINLKPKPGWKINQEFPTKLQVTAPEGVTLAKDSQSPAEAATFTEKGAAFDVAFTATEAGDKSFAANFRFAVCTDATCDPKTAELAWNLSVK